MRRQGFTLTEIMVSTTLMLTVFAIAIPFFRGQSRAVSQSTGRMEATQSARFVLSLIDRELRLAGGETGQPIFVEVTPFAVTFNANLTSRIANDPNAVFVDVDADSLLVDAWRLDRAGTLPLTGTAYPVADYNDANGNLSGAETISFWVSPDATSSRSDMFNLWRRVNDGDSTLVARDIYIPADTAWLFRFSRATATGDLAAVADALLPLDWTDTTGVVDSLRVVETRVSVLFTDTRDGREVVQTVYGRTRLLNAGLLQESTCGTSPIGPTNVTADLQLDAEGAPASVRVEWDRSVEEAGGERDVALYLIQRRPSAGGAWESLSNVPANGDASYAFEHFELAPGAWVYGVLAQDCSPANSAVVTATAVTIP